MTNPESKFVRAFMWDAPAVLWRETKPAVMALVDRIVYLQRDRFNIATVRLIKVGQVKRSLNSKEQ